MFIRTIHKHTLYTGGVALLFALTAYILLSYPAALANGVSRGLSICGAVIIPTLYPFMIFAGLLADSPLCTRPSRLAGALTQRLFRLPACCGPAMLISLVGGYPAGGLAIARLRDTGQIHRDEARRMTLFCVNAGPAFIVSTVGAGLLGSVRAGWLLFAAHAATSLLMGILLGQRATTPSAASSPTSRRAPRTLAIVVRDSCQSLIAMCGFVLLACAGLSVWEASGLPLALQRLTGLAATQWSAVVAGVTEVSCGCIAVAGNGVFTPFWLALCLGWGGLSVQGQLATVLGRDGGVFSLPFWLARLCHGVISGSIATLLFRWIPVNLPTVSGPAATPFYASPSASVMLLIFSFMAMLCFYPKKTGNSKESML